MVSASADDAHDALSIAMDWENEGMIDLTINDSERSYTIAEFVIWVINE